MKIHFACSTTELAARKAEYRAVVQEIKKQGHTIVRDWLEEAIELSKKNYKDLDRSHIYKKTYEAIIAADLVIVEATVSSFGIGHQIGLAISKDKPVLCLVNKNSSELDSAGNSKFLDGMHSSLITISEYDSRSLPSIIKRFVEMHTSRASVKFNIVLNKEIDHYLDWVSYTQNINKSEFIRNLILKHMDEGNWKEQKLR